MPLGFFDLHKEHDQQPQVQIILQHQNLVKRQLNPSINKWNILALVKEMIILMLVTVVVILDSLKKFHYQLYVQKKLILKKGFTIIN